MAADPRRAPTIALAFALACALPGLALAMQDQPDAQSADAVTPRVAVAWSSLTPEQQRLLAPIESQWQQLAPRQQQRLVRRAERWQRLPPDAQDRARDRLARYAAMTPAQRAAARQRLHEFQQLPPEEKQRMREAWRRFHDLSPEQRRALREEFEKSEPADSPQHPSGWAHRGGFSPPTYKLRRKRWAEAHPIGPP
jgi:hypothetical protein